MAGSTIVLTGRVASEVQTEMTSSSHVLTKFRLAVPARRYDKESSRIVPSGVSHYTVVCWRTLAQNVAKHVSRGDSVVVAGRLRVRDWRADDGRTGTVAEVSATTIGHDLAVLTAESDAA